MPDKKLTDSEVMEALKHYLINRLKAENSNLTSDLTSLKTDLTSLRAENERLQNCVDEYNIQVVNQREQIEKLVGEDK